MKNLSVYGLLLCFVCFVCGTGCGDNSPDNANNDILSGNYLGVFNSFSDSTFGAGDVIYNGDGTGSYDYGTLTNMTYSAASDYTVTGSSSNGTGNGIMVTDGSLVIWSSENYMEFNFLELTGASDASLNGDYNSVFLSPAGTNGYGAGVVTYDGTGGTDYTYDIGDTSTGASDYSVAANGELTAPGYNSVGAINDDGTMAVWIDENYIELHFKVLTSATAADLNGSYNAIMFSGTGAYSIGTVTYDGAGNGTYGYTEGSTDSGTFTYTVNSDGTLEGTDGTATSNGIMNSDGSMVAFIGDTYLEIHVKK